MRGIINDQISHQFIEGPIRSKPADNGLQGGTAEKTAYPADQTLSSGAEGDDNDIDISYYETTERHD